MVDTWPPNPEPSLATGSPDASCPRHGSVTPLLCSPSGNFTFERWRPQPPAYTVTIRNDAFFLMLIAWGDFHSVAVARTGRGANRSRDLEFRRWYRGFSGRQPSWVRPAGGSKSDCGALALFGFALCGFRGRVFTAFLVVGVLARNEPHLSEGLHHGQVAADAAVGSRADVMTTLSQEHRIFGVPECP